MLTMLPDINKIKDQIEKQAREEYKNYLQGKKKKKTL